MMLKIRSTKGDSMCEPAFRVAERFNLPDYFMKRLKQIEEKETHPRTDVLIAEAELFAKAVFIADHRDLDLQKVLELGRMSRTAQLLAMKELSEMDVVLNRHSRVLIDAIRFVCHENEKIFADLDRTEPLGTGSLPPYFERRLSISTDSSTLRPIFEQATCRVKKSRYQLAEILNEEDHTSPVALQAIRYVCYHNDHPEEEEHSCSVKVTFDHDSGRK